MLSWDLVQPAGWSGFPWPVVGLLAGNWQRGLGRANCKLQCNRRLPAAQLHPGTSADQQSVFSRLFWDFSKTSPPNSSEVKPAQLSLGTRSDKEWLFKCWDKCWVTRLNNDFPNVMQLNLQLNLQLLYIQLHRWVKATAAETFLWIVASLCSAAKLLLSEHCDPACNAVQLSLSNGNDNASNAIKCYCARGCISVCTYVLFAKLNF